MKIFRVGMRSQFGKYPSVISLSLVNALKSVVKKNVQLTQQAKGQLVAHSGACCTGPSL